VFPLCIVSAKIRFTFKRRLSSEEVDDPLGEETQFSSLNLDGFCIVLFDLRTSCCTGINELCEGTLSTETQEFLKSLNRPLPNFTDDVTRLFGTNFDTAYVNQEMLEELEGDIFVFKAKDEGKLLSA
jgi:hypothetical protein